jgi:hypothetical protein
VQEAALLRDEAAQVGSVDEVAWVGVELVLSIENT